MAKAKRQIGCCGGVRIGKSIVRNASKTIEKQMIQHADALYENPFLVLPEFKDASCKRMFRKISKQIEKISKLRDDIEKLEKISNKKSLAAAIAGTILIHHAKKAPFLAAAPISTGSVLYAQRGNALREHLIAVQHYDDPFLRLLGIRDIVLRNNLHVYSWDESFICTGKSAQPSKGFISFIMNYHNLTYSKNIARCSHVHSHCIKDKEITDSPYLFLYWASADVSVGICKQCASKKSNFIFETTKFLIEPDVQHDFQIEVIGKILQDENTLENETFFQDEYYSGKLSDFQMIDKNMNQRFNKLKDSSEISYILNNKSYETMDDFIHALHPNDYEKKALLFLLKHLKESLVVSNVTPNTVIEMLWADHGLALLKEIVGDNAKANDLFSLSESPSQIIKLTYDLQQRKEILENLPTYHQLPPLAKFADTLARIYRTEGKEKIIIEAKKHPEGTKGKSISYGFLLAVDKAKDYRWKYKKEEVESGEFLKPYIQALLTCPTKKYHQSLQDLLTFGGTSIDITQYKK